MTKWVVQDYRLNLTLAAAGNKQLQKCQVSSLNGADRRNISKVCILMACTKQLAIGDRQRKSLHQVQDKS